MSQWSGNEAQARERLSALIDGELDDDAMAQACALWHERADVRASWHAWHLIGDVLRSDDLAADPARDAAFLRSLRARLAHEPVVLAPSANEPAPAVAIPAPMRSVAARRRLWRTPAAIAAGFMAVAAALVVTQTPAPSPAAREPVLARSSSDSTALQRVASQTVPAAQTAQDNPSAADPQTFVINGSLIRDARLDQYLAAHQQFSGSSALGAPSAFLRSATAEAPAR